MKRLHESRLPLYNNDQRTPVVQQSKIRGSDTGTSPQGLENSTGNATSGSTTGDNGMLNFFNGHPRDSLMSLS